jgi:hypothetical protein
MPKADKNPITWPSGAPASRRGLFGAVAGLTLAGTAVTDARHTIRPHADAELLRLGALLQAAWAEENAAFAVVDGLSDGAAQDAAEKAAVALQRRTSAIVDRIEGTRARTLGGLRIKLSALNWCYSDEPLTAENLAGSRMPCTDTRLLASMLRDLSQIGRA